MTHYADYGVFLIMGILIGLCWSVAPRRARPPGPAPYEVGLRSIETAPRDGSLVFVFVPAFGAVPPGLLLARWGCDQGRACWVLEGCGRLDGKALMQQPTHWRP